MSLQPNLRYGYNIVLAEWNEKVDWASYTDQEVKYSESSQQFGLDIVLPFVYKINEDYSIGADICICGSS